MDEKAWTRGTEAGERIDVRLTLVIGRPKVHGYVVETASTMSRTRLDQITVMFHEHLVDRWTENMEVGHTSTSISHA